MFQLLADQSQSLLSGKGPLAELEHSQGLYRISLLLPVQSGQWKLRAMSDGHVTFNVIGNARNRHFVKWIV